jgi:predicted AlkP superfamily pyrophosphatase or phosphodiesterase
MKLRLAFFALAATAVLGLVTASSGQGARERTPRPRLVVLVSIDQCRADYMTRYDDLFLPARSGKTPGGFKYLQSRGAWYPDCRYQHYRTVTAVGHSILGSGAQPSVSGIVGNDWFDRDLGKSTYSTDDPQSKVVGAGPGSTEKPMSPAHQLVTTLDDELELATGGQSKTASVSLKDRAAILMAGHRADSVIWFDESTGGFVSSSFYCKDGRLPGWVERFNSQHLANDLRQKPWEPSVDDAALKRIWNPTGKNLHFKHALTGKDFTPFTVSPAGNDFVFAAARDAVKYENLGQDEIPDVLTINLASNDYTGHAYGPDSAEMLDITVQTDRQLSDFLGYLDGAVPGGLKNVTFAVCADHGVANIPELNSQSGVPASRAAAKAIQDKAEKALDDAFGEDNWVISIANGEIYFSDAAVDRHPTVSRSAMEDRVIEALRNERGVYMCLGKSAVLSGRVPVSDFGRRVTQSVNPQRSGDVIVVLQPQWLAGAAPIGTGTSHGTPFPYDTHVPLLVCGSGVTPGIYTQSVAPAQLAPSFAFLLGVARPSGADGAILPGFGVAGL